MERLTLAGLVRALYGVVMDEHPNAWLSRMLEFNETYGHGKQRENPATEKILGGKQEAQLIALRLGPPPRGYANWTLRLLGPQGRGVGDRAAISHETVRRTLKKTA